jgi:hypothetical protein
MNEFVCDPSEISDNSSEVLPWVAPGTSVRPHVTIESNGGGVTLDWYCIYCWSVAPEV